MSSVPECRRCGNYVFHGPCLCEKCADSDETSKLRARAEAAEAKVKDLEESMRMLNDLYEEALDREARLKKLVLVITGNAT